MTTECTIMFQFFVFSKPRNRIHCIFWILYQESCHDFFDRYPNLETEAVKDRRVLSAIKVALQASGFGDLEMV